jgi:peptidoglycan/LPS O-acetylase OafA/YrhL
MTAPDRRTPRLHALDALRGIAMLLGVVLHASVSYMPHRMPDLLWAVHDRDSSPLFDWMFWWIHGFRLPLFFVIAGFFAVVVYDSRGPASYLAHRTRRLLLPLLAGAVVVLPLLWAVWCCGWLLTGRCSLEEARRMKFAPEIQANLYGPCHLWFLEHLFLMSVLFCGMRWLRSVWAARSPLSIPLFDWRDRLLGWRWRPVLLAVPTAALLWYDPAAVFGFHNTFVPETLRLAYYGLFFVVGTWLARGRHRLETFQAGHGVYLALSLPVLIALGLLLRHYLDEGLSGPGLLLLAVAAALFAWLSVFGFLGLFLRFFHRERPVLRYLADASYWIYLVHLPVAGLVQVVLTEASGPAAVKFGVVISLASAVGLMTYQGLVRHTFIGAFLNGPVQKSLAPPKARSAAA